jgi:hypothetical protein
MSLYRSYAPVLDEHWARFRRRRESERELDAAVSLVFARRCARIAGGIAGIASGLAMVLASYATISHTRYGHLTGWAPGTCLLLAGTPLALVAYAFSRRAALEWARAALGQEPQPSGDPAIDLARIDAADPLADLRARTMALESKSLAFPLVATILLGPLLIHFFVGLLIAALQKSWFCFDVWIAASFFLVGVAYAVAIILVVRWARSLRLRETAMLGQGLEGAWVCTLLITTLAALFPSALAGAAMGVLPPLFVAGTGVIVLPLAYGATLSRLRRERGWLEGR